MVGYDIGLEVAVASAGVPIGVIGTRCDSWRVYVRVVWVCGMDDWNI